MARPHKISVILVLLFCFQAGHAEWVKQNTGTLSWLKDIFFVNSTKGWIVGSNGAMFSTIDGGGTWVPSKKFTSDTISQVYFTSDTTGWLLCQRSAYARESDAISYLRKTTDGGRTWERIEIEDAGRVRLTGLTFNKQGSGTAFGESGVLYTLQEDGSSWKKSSSSFHFLLLDGAYSDRNVGAIVGAGGTIFFTEDSGLTWEKASILDDSATRFNAVYFAGHDTGWAVGTKGRIFRSNGGRLWRRVESGTTVDLNDICLTANAGGWAVGDQGTILRTSDGGSSWTAVNSHVTHKLEKVMFLGDRGWAIGFGGTLLAYDPGSANSRPGPRPLSEKGS